MKRRSNKSELCKNVTPQSCGRSTKSTVWKLSFLLLGIMIALVYRNTDPGSEVVSKLSETLTSEYLMLRLEEWLESKLRSGVSEEAASEAGESELVRMFDSCVADNITLTSVTSHPAGESQVIFSQITAGQNKIYFSESSWCRSNLEVESIEGEWRPGGLEGPVNITFTDGRFALGYFRRGAVEGELRTYRCLLGSCNVWEEEEDSRHDFTVASHLESLIYHRAGRPQPSPRSWWFPVGGGLLSCAPDQDGLAEGEDCVYVYPDITTALLGSWSSGRLVQAREARLVNLHVTDGQLELVVRPTGGKEEVLYRQDVSTSTLISSQPHLTDPFEEKTVYVAQSGIEGAGEGLFLRRDVKAGDLVAFYNGVRMSEHEARVRKEDRRSPYRIHGWDGEILNIPVGQHLTDNYSASSAHKANHAKKANSEFRNLEHPRFGKILGIFMLKDGVAGEEILVDYGYIEKAQATEAGIQMLLEAAQAMSGLSDRKEFKQEMKRAIGYIREKVGHLRPLINTMKMAKSFMS